MKRLFMVTALAMAMLGTISCSQVGQTNARTGNLAFKFAPSDVIDLGALITEDLPERLWGKALLKQMHFTRPNSFDVIKWTFPVEGGSISGSNGYYTVFNHGGPHVDAPNHLSLGDGVDSYPIEAFSGPVKAFDVSTYAPGRSIPVEIFKGHIEAGDVVLIFTRYTPPHTDGALPQVVTLTREAAEFLATLPVRAYGTDSWSVDGPENTKLPSIHHSFLMRRIPIYEELFNVDKLLGKENMVFVGVPLKIKGGDGMIVRPVVFVFGSGPSRQ
jgi:kynurenine formamidase